MLPLTTDQAAFVDFKDDRPAEAKRPTVAGISWPAEQGERLGVLPVKLELDTATRSWTTTYRTPIWPLG